MDRSRVLIVDDETVLLQLYVLQLGAEYDVDIADSGEVALEQISRHGPYAVVVADMHMPGMSGDEFLKRVQTVSPLTVRVMLTADEDQSVAVNAVNLGQVFRFLNKPCTETDLRRAVRQAAEQHRLYLAEKELLANTLNGSVALLGEMLSTLKPLAFGRSRRIKRLVERICDSLEVADSWEIAIAASLSHVGCFMIPDSLLLRIELGERLSDEDLSIWQSHPRLARDLLAKIPRLERIVDIIVRQHDCYRAELHQPVCCRGLTEWRAGLLRTAEEYDALFQRSRDVEEAIRSLCSRENTYPRDVLEALISVVRVQKTFRTRRVCVWQLREGMVLEEEITDVAGGVLVTKGQDISEVLMVALNRRVQRGCAVREPILVREFVVGDEPSDDPNLNSSDHSRLGKPTFVDEFPVSNELPALAHSAPKSSGGS